VTAAGASAASPQRSTAAYPVVVHGERSHEPDDIDVGSGNGLAELGLVVGVQEARNDQAPGPGVPVVLPDGGQVPEAERHVELVTGWRRVCASHLLKIDYGTRQLLVVLEDLRDRGGHAGFPNADWPDDVQHRDWHLTVCSAHEREPSPAFAGLMPEPCR